MKTIRFSIFGNFLLVLVLFTNIVNATVWRVNNNTNYSFWSGTQVFNSLQTAISSDLVMSGDIIYLEASATNYANALITNKALTIIGPGYFLGENTGLQANPTSAKITTLTFGIGSSGSSIYGVEFAANNSSIVLSVANESLSNITISRCKLAGSISAPSNAGNINNLLITKSYLNNIFIAGTGTLNVTNLIIANNYIADNINLKSNTTGSIYQNVIQSYASFYGLPFYNNIILRTSANGIVQNNNSSTNVYNNISRFTQPSWLIGGNNIFGITNDAYLFANIADTSDKKYQLKPQNVCPECYQGLAPNIQIGMYGGADPYILSGIPGIPSIYLLQSSSSTNQNGTLSVTISSKSNN